MSNDHPTPPHQPPAQPHGQPHGQPGPPGTYGPPGAYGQPPGQAPGPHGTPAPGQAPGPYGAQAPGPYGPQPSGSYGAQPPGPYATPPAHPPYPSSPGAAPYPPPGAHPHGWAGAAPYYDPSQPLAMPGSVRAAQIVIFATTGLAVLLTVLVAGGSGAYDAGRFAGSYLATAVMCVLAFQYAKAGNGVRVASVVLASLQILFGLSAMGQGIPFGFLWLGSAIAVIVVLSQGSAKQWFRRYRPNGVPPHHS
ncbi:hypothetical protein AB0D65_29920 [Streptomyces griseoloalbus]|uniref:Integral membrane protein n=1 Tax=Streptomyces griseoloalbus TaxID=67303 RepID=A0ABV3EFX8_9ACTN